MPKLLSLLLVFVFCGCASRKPSLKTDDFLSNALNHPANFAPAEVQTRYWAFENFLIHFVTNINEQNKNLAPVIYIHGVGGGLDDFSDLIKRIHSSRTSRPYYAIDLPLFGQSVMQKADLSIHDYTEILQEFVSMLSTAKVSLVCHSMGGQVCIEFALVNPSQIHLLTLISPSGIFEKSAFINEATNQFAGISVGPIDYPYANSFSDMSWYNQEFTRRMITDNPVILMGIESYRENFHDRITKLKTKTLVLWGREDKIFSFENGLFLKENVEDSTLYVIDGAGHSPFESHGELLSKLIQKYL
jgi:2-hydroxy-6-oxonona-2,4-dienedioate hydrolase